MCNHSQGYYNDGRANEDHTSGVVGDFSLHGDEHSAYARADGESPELEPWALMQVK